MLTDWIFDAAWGTESVMIRELSPADILSSADYAGVREEKRTALAKSRRLRRVAVGPFAMFTFESYDTMWFQVHEMLRIEKGGDEQLTSELEAYNPLIPSGRDLVATLMLEISDPTRRDRELCQLGGIENKVFLRVGDAVIGGVPEADQKRTDEEGRASSVHFFHFRFTPEQIGAFADLAVLAVLEIDHPNYAYATGLMSKTRAELARDFA